MNRKIQPNAKPQREQLHSFDEENSLKPKDFDQKLKEALKKSKPMPHYSLQNINDENDHELQTQNIGFKKNDNIAQFDDNEVMNDYPPIKRTFNKKNQLEL